MESKVAEQKKQLRGELLRLRRETPRQQKQAIDRQICQHVINSPEYRQAQTGMLTTSTMSLTVLALALLLYLF